MSQIDRHHVVLKLINGASSLIRLTSRSSLRLHESDARSPQPTLRAASTSTTLLNPRLRRKDVSS